MPAGTAPGPLLLALDTATETLAIALVQGAALHTHTEPGGAAASARLLPAVHGLLHDAGVALSALDAVAFVQGPGAFTGLRTACAVAQGLGYGLGRPLLPLDGLMLVAEDAAAAAGLADGDTVWVAMDARMDEAYAAQYRRRGQGDGARWQVLAPPALWTLPALAEAAAEAADAADAAAAGGPTVVAGSAIGAFAGRVAWPAASRRQPQEHDRAAALGRLAAAAWADGATVAPAAALPLYLRDKVALTTAERAARAAATP